jgi:hypothetical protein
MARVGDRRVDKAAPIATGDSGVRVPGEHWKTAVGPKKHIGPEVVGNLRARRRVWLRPVARSADRFA